MNCVIIDDEPAAIEVLKFHLSSIPFVTLQKSFRNPLDALDYLQKHEVDLLFLGWVAMSELMTNKFKQTNESNG